MMPWGRAASRHKWPRQDGLWPHDDTLQSHDMTSTGVLSWVQDGVVLGADTRSTAGSTVADKNCEKIHYIAPNIYCCGAGTAADTENVTGMVSSALELHRYGTGRGSRVVTALTLLKSHLFRRVAARAGCRWCRLPVPRGGVRCSDTGLKPSASCPPVLPGVEREGWPSLSGPPPCNQEPIALFAGA